MLHKRKAKSAGAPAPAATKSTTTPAASPAQPAEPSAPAASPAPSTGSPAGDKAASSPVARPVGRPATKPHCVKCGKRVERCNCKEGAILPAEVAAAVDRARQEKEAKPLERDEAEQILRFLCWMSGMAESAIAAVVVKIPWDEAQEAYCYTEEDVARLLPPAHRILAKYAHKLPTWMRDCRDEFALVMAFHGVQMAKQDRLGELLELRAERERIAEANKQAQTKANGSAPLPRDIADSIGKNSAPATPTGSN